MVKEEKITKISAQKRLGRYNVFINEQFAFGVSEDVLIAHDLHKGLILTPELKELVQADTAKNEAYQQALNYLSYQLRSEKEVRTQLRKKEYELDAIDDAVAHLHRLKLLDDKMYAGSFARTQVLITNKGPREIQRQLQQKGVQTEEAQQAISELDEADLLANGLKIAQKLAKRYQKEAFKEQVNKIRMGLMTKGYPKEMITLIMEELALDKEDEQEESALKEQGDKLWRRHERLDAKKRNQKIKQSLYQKGFNMDDINHYLEDKTEENEFE